MGLHFKFCLAYETKPPTRLGVCEGTRLPLSAVMLLIPGGSPRGAEDPVGRVESVTWLSKELCSKESGCSFPDSTSGGIPQVCRTEQEFRGETP